MFETVDYESYWILNEEEKKRLMSDYGIVRTTAAFDPSTGTLRTHGINADDLNFDPVNFSAAFVVYNGRYYPVYLKEHDPHEYVDLELEIVEEETEQDAE